MKKDELLKTISVSKARLDGLFSGQAVNSAFWRTWKFYAQHDPCFDRLLYESGLKIPDRELRVRQDSLQGVLPDGFVSYEHGIKIWEERLQLEQEVSACKDYLCGLLVEARENPNVSWVEIAEALGVTTNGAYKLFQRYGIL